MTPNTRPLDTQSIRMLPARIFRLACSRNGCRFEIREERRSRLSIAGILLNISSRSKASSSLGWRAAASCTVAKRSRRSRAWALRWSSKEATAKTPMATTTKTSMAISASMIFRYRASSDSFKPPPGTRIVLHAGGIPR